MKKEIPRLVIFTLSLLLFVLSALKLAGFSFLVNLEKFVNQSISVIQSPFILKLMSSLSFLFSLTTITAISILMIIFLYLKISKWDSLLFAFALSLTAVIVQTLKWIFQSSRPENILVYDTSFGFPSGHSTTAVVFLGLVSYLVFKHSKSIYTKFFTLSVSIILSIGVAISRIYLHAHWLTDVIGGLSLGFLILIILIPGFNHLEKKFY